MSLLPKDLTHHTDEELLRLLRENDKKVFAILFDRYGSDLYLYIKKIILVHTSSRQVQYETQKILIDVFKSLCDPPRIIPVSLEHYLFDLAHTKAMIYVRLYNSSPYAASHLN